MDNADLNYYSLMDTHEYYYYFEGTLYLASGMCSPLLSAHTMHVYYLKKCMVLRWRSEICSRQQRFKVFFLVIGSFVVSNS